MAKPPGPDALRRAAIKAARRADERARSDVLHGPDPRELEPYPYRDRPSYDSPTCPNENKGTP